MSLSFEHKSLGSTITGIGLDSTVKFLGIPYGQVSERFGRPESIRNFPNVLDCTNYGPRCPQVPVDVGYLLRIPPENPLPFELEDEFKCLNLDVVLPKEALSNTSRKLPVFLWIHGGSQAMTFGSAASKVCDTTPIVKHALSLGKPIIAVSIQYRLGIFAFGDRTNAGNLALLDQALALEWVQSHIRNFGGDPENITLAGESAGAVYCHAHMVMNAPARQFVLSSGSLYLSPPQPQQKAQAIREAVMEKLKILGDFTLKDSPVSELIEAVRRSGIQSWFLQTNDELQNWQDTEPNRERLLISDVANEAAIYRAGIWSSDTKAVAGIFEKAGKDSDEIKRLYGIFPERPSSCKTGALDFINDYKFALPVQVLTQQWRSAGKKVFRCLIDENNPWQPSHGAHHAVDLILLFGGFDLSFSPMAQQTGRLLREKWIEFINGQDPWPPSNTVAFGPHGAFEKLSDSGLRSHRRVTHLNFLASADRNLLDEVVGTLSAGRLSLLN